MHSVLPGYTGQLAAISRLLTDAEMVRRYSFCWEQFRVPSSFRWVEKVTGHVSVFAAGSRKKVPLSSFILKDMSLFWGSLSLSVKDTNVFTTPLRMNGKS